MASGESFERSDGSEAFRRWLEGPPKRNQEQVADQLGVAQQTVSSWARGKCPTVLHRIKIKRLTGVPVEAWATTPERRREETLTETEEQDVLDAEAPESSRVPDGSKGSAA